MPNAGPVFLLAACSGARFGLGVWVLYYLRFTNYAGIGLVESLMIATAFFLEIPTGALADLLGKKRTLQLAFLFFTLGYVLLSGTYNFPTLCIAVLVFTTGGALFSGTFEAFVYDALQSEGLESNYARTIGRIQGVRLTTLAVTCAVGGHLYAYSPRLPFAVSTIGFGIGLCTAFFLREPGANGIRLSPRNFFVQTGRGLSHLARPLRDRTVFRFLWVTGLFTVIAEELLDDVLAVAFGYSPIQLGWLFALIYLGAAAASASGGFLADWLGRRRLMILLNAAAAVSLLAAPFAGLWLGGLTVAFRYAMRAVIANLETEQLNSLAEPGSRATLISTFTLLKKLPYVLTAYGVGTLIDAWGASRVALWLGVLLLGSVLFFGPRIDGHQK